MELLAKNWAGYYEYLVDIVEDINIKITECSDPYKQWKLGEVKKISNMVLFKYSKFLDEMSEYINSDEMKIKASQGSKFVKILDEMLNEYSNTYKLKKDMYEKINIQAQINQLTLMFREFNKFRIED